MVHQIERLSHEKKLKVPTDRKSVKLKSDALKDRRGSQVPFM